MEMTTINRAGELVLPEPVRRRYGLEPDVPIGIVEASGGILLIHRPTSHLATRNAKSSSYGKARTSTRGLPSPTQRDIGNRRTA